ncbi:MAG: hypothetical protein M0R80_07695 [Proteobacteria bacterium]|nr:hypothetical protein [Pseudomonadota bacterium]
MLIDAIRTIAGASDEKAQTEAALKLCDIIQPSEKPFIPVGIGGVVGLEAIEASVTVSKRKLFSRLLSDSGFDDGDIDCILSCLKKAEQ